MTLKKYSAEGPWTAFIQLSRPTPTFGRSHNIADAPMYFAEAPPLRALANFADIPPTLRTLPYSADVPLLCGCHYVADAPHPTSWMITEMAEFFII